MQPSILFSCAGTNLTKNRVVRLLFQNSEKTCPARELKPPVLNITMVLRSNTHLPYEPLKLSVDQHLTLKTCFLFLASTKKVSNLHEP